MKKLINPATINTDVVRAFLARAREYLDDIEAELVNVEDKPNRFIYVFISRAALLGELSTRNVRAWAVEWIRNGASVAQAAKAARLSQTGLTYWKQKDNDQGVQLPDNQPQEHPEFRPDTIQD